jgi:cyclase
MDVKKVLASKEIPSGYEMVIHGGRTFTGLDALRWAKEAERLGTGEICLNSIDADGTLDGYELDLTALISSHVGIPVIASGGAGKPEHLLDVLTRGKADAALIASMVHYRTHTIAEIKSFLHERGVNTRMLW